MQKKKLLQRYSIKKYFYYINTDEIPGGLSRENLISSHVKIRACLHWGGAPQVGEVTCLGEVKKKPFWHVILQPRHPGVHFLKIIEWSLST